MCIFSSVQQVIFNKNDYDWKMKRRFGRDSRKSPRNTKNCFHLNYVGQILHVHTHAHKHGHKHADILVALLPHDVMR